MATNSITMTFDRVRDDLKKLIESFAAVVAPCGDWPQRILFQCAEGFAVMPLDVVPLTTVEERALFFLNIVPEVARSVNAERVAFVAPAWYVEPEDDARYAEYLEEGGLISAHPLRRECVNLLLVDGERTEAWVAEVRRRPHQSPTLGEWTGPAEPDGALIDGMRLCLSER
jgi:hypothetical protein